METKSSPKETSERPPRTPPSTSSISSISPDDKLDADDLKRFGYQQSLRRTMGAFSSFALAFSILSINTGIFANFQSGIRQVGPAVVWSWLVVVVGQLLVAMVHSELVTHYPISGSGYQWASRLTHPHYGFCVGWIALIGCLTGFPAVCGAFSECVVAMGLSPVKGPVLTVIVIWIVTGIQLSGIKLASIVTDAGVVTEILAAVIITVIFLFIFGPSSGRGLRVITDTTNYATGKPAGLSAFALSLLMGAWCLTGFESAAALAEETHHPRSVIPRAMLLSLISSGVIGFLMLVGFMLAIGDLRAIQGSEQPLLAIIEGKLGPKATPVVMISVLVSIFACAVAGLGAISRFVYSLARDNMLPFSGALKWVQPRTQTPMPALIVIAVASSLVALKLETIAIIASVSTVAAYLGHGSIVAAALVTKHERVEVEGGFTLGRWRTPIRVVALLWTLFVVGALLIPDMHDDRLPLKSVAGGIALGAVLYWAVIRGRIQRGEAGPPIAVETPTQGAANL